MKRDLLENPVEIRTAVPAPHFEDRRVVMRAQPVVPLQEIRTKLKLRRLWFLSGAFAVAMILGAASALVAVRVKRIAANSEIPQIEEQADTTVAETPLVQEEPVADSEALAEAETPVVHQPVRITKQEQPPLAQRPRIVGRDREPLSSHSGVQPSEDEQLEQIREAVLYEQWQERRARRAARRERRNRGDRDLSRVDEIFEGPRRPERP